MREENTVGKVGFAYQDEAEAYSDFKVNVNFTPAPQATCSSESVATPVTKDIDQRGDEGGQKLSGTTEEMNATMLTLLVDLFQQ